MISSDLNGIFDLAAILLISIGAFLCWRNRKSSSAETKTKNAPLGPHVADTETIGLSRQDDAANSHLNN